MGAGRRLPPPRRGQPRQVAGSTSISRTPELDIDAMRPQRRGTARGDRVRVDDPGDDANHAGPNERLGARTGAADVIARFHRDHGGAAARPLTRGRERPDLGVWPAGVGVEPLADDLACLVEDDAADDRVGAGRSEPS
jgi:hypothetical protein